MVTAKDVRLALRELEPTSTEPAASEVEPAAGEAAGTAEAAEAAGVVTVADQLAALAAAEVAAHAVAEEEASIAREWCEGIGIWMRPPNLGKAHCCTCGQKGHGREDCR